MGLTWGSITKRWHKKSGSIPGMFEADHANASRCLLITLAIRSCVSLSKVFPSLNVLSLIFFSSHSSTGLGFFSLAISALAIPVSQRSPNSSSLPLLGRCSQTSPRYLPFAHRPRRPPTTSYLQLAGFPAQAPRHGAALWLRGDGNQVEDAQAHEAQAQQITRSMARALGQEYQKMTLLISIV